MQEAVAPTRQAEFRGGRGLVSTVEPRYGASPQRGNSSDKSGPLSRVDGFAPDRTRTFYESTLKRCIDLTASLVLLVLIAPLLLVIALAARKCLGPGVIFRQTRVGLGGRPFTLYKFRSMAPDCRNTQLPFDGPDRRLTHKHPNDPRLTPFGKFLRTWSLDELPQLWNVVRGDMSLVGPRPELVTIVDTYSPWQHLRHEVKPGLTGLWQVTSRGDGMMHENTDVDLEYIERLRPLFDLKILLLTIPAVLGLRRGY